VSSKNRVVEKSCRRKIVIKRKIELAI